MAKNDSPTPTHAKPGWNKASKIGLSILASLFGLVLLIGIFGPSREEIEAMEAARKEAETSKAIAPVEIETPPPRVDLSPYQKDLADAFPEVITHYGGVDVRSDWVAVKVSPAWLGKPERVRQSDADAIAKKWQLIAGRYGADRGEVRVIFLDSHGNRIGDGGPFGASLN